MTDERARFSGEKYMNPQTFRRDGEAVPTPMWFADEEETRYTRTFEKTGSPLRCRFSSRSALTYPTTSCTLIV